MSKKPALDGDARHWEFLNVALVQTSLNHAAAWRNGVGPPMHPSEQTLAWEEIQWCLRCFRASDPKPHLVLIPELSLPRGRLDDLSRASKACGAVMIAGVDYRLEGATQRAFNEVVVLIPNKWKTQSRSRRTTRLFVGKTYPALREAELLKQSGGWIFVNEPSFWLFDAAEAGRFGVSICYDFLDLERALMYKEQIQHLFVVAYNRDIQSFFHMAESLARTMYCNVVICNTGFHGGSLAVTPYYEPWQRMVYRHNGNRMLASQVIQLPVRAMVQAQLGKAPARTFKSLPPGWKNSPTGKIRLVQKEERIC